MAVYNKKAFDFNPNVAQVWVEEPGFTGYKGLDFTKIDQIEDLLRSGINVSVTGAGQSVAVTGTLPSVTIANGQSVNVGTVSNLPAITVAAGQNVGVNSLPAVNIAADQKVGVTGVLPAVTIAAGQNVGVNSLPAVNIAAGQSIDITGTVSTSIEALKNNFSSVLFSDSNTPSGLVVYQTNLNKDLDNVTAVISGAVNTNPEKSSTISNYTVGTSNGTVLGINSDRKELYIQNLATGNLYIKYGLNASNASFNFVLAANTAENAGDGGSLSDQGYTGIVSVSGDVGPRYISWERS